MSSVASIEDFSAPLFVAWQLTNRCGGRCLACCEESGPDKAWPDELGREEAIDVARQIAETGIPYVAFGGGEPMRLPYIWEIFQTLSDGGVAIKIETDGGELDDAAVERLAGLRVDNVQVSVDGVTAETHEALRPGAASFAEATGALQRLSARNVPAEWVFVPSRRNLHEAVAAYELAAELGCSVFVTGPLMRLGRAALDWQNLAPGPPDWAATVEALEARAAAAGGPRLAIYPWDIETEIQRRLESPQAMILIVPNGRVKLLNALPFAPGDLRRQTVEQAWRSYQQAWRSQEVADFVARCRNEPGLLRHANETWPVPSVEAVDTV